MFTITDKSRWFFLVSGILVLLSIVALVVSTLRFGPPLYMDAELAGAEEAKAAGLVLLVAIIVIPAFVWWSLRRVPTAFRYGVCVATVLLHNGIITGGFYALMSIVAGWQSDVLFFAALLAVTGFSIQDAVAVLSRTQENVLKRRAELYSVVATRSILESMTPTLTVRLCALFVLVGLVVVGGSLRPFAATLLAGTVAETYAVLFIAVPLLATWDRAAARRAVQTTV